MKHIPYLFGAVYCLGLVGLSVYNTRNQIRYYDARKNRWI